MVSLAKRILLGKPIATSEEGHQRLKKRVALPIFASDAISSTAYATDEIILVLVAQAGIGTAAFGYLVPISFVVAALLVIVVRPTARRSTPTRRAAGPTSSPERTSERRRLWWPAPH